MRRRDFLGVLGGAAAAPIVAPLPARTQQAMPVIGFLNGSVAASVFRKIMLKQESRAPTAVGPPVTATPAGRR